jgi:ATP-dependent exoDNAse (exonuclease V) beta subunit
MRPPVDQASRERFASELDKNFSVIASAGSGKTRAITDRIVQIARSAHAREWLPNLVVVTFTNRAADEMQQRSRQQILEAGVPLDVLLAFNRVYFGTIHSFAVKLLANYGHHLGLPAKLDLITDDEDLWKQFVESQTIIGRSLSSDDRRVLLRHVQARQLMELARRGDLQPVGATRARRCPPISFSAVYSYVARGSALKKIPLLQDELRRWEQSWRDGEDFLRWPMCTTQVAEFQELWREAFAPLRRWVNDCSLCVAAEVQRDYREFRVDRGALTYADQIGLAVDLMQHPEAARRIREKNYRVILDEAQDTDPHQFSLLLEITRPPSAQGNWLESKTDHPRAGHFSMVGDFQQSIYRSRADLAQYRRVHESLVKTDAGEEVEFSVTFRLDHAGVDFVNQTFRGILNNLEGQVPFVELNPRPDVLPGQIVRVELTAAELRSDSERKIADRHRAASEAKQLAQWLHSAGLQKLRARSWSDVAILCPRKAWLRPLRSALRNVGFAVQTQSESELKGDSAAYAWLTALVMIMADPLLSYEIVGVLRETFGISDHELAVFSEGYGGRFQIAEPTRGTGPVVEVLNQLTQTRLAIETQPLFTAVTLLVRQTRLRERLESLPAEEVQRLDEELDTLLAAAATAEADGSSIAQFAESLVLNFEAAREVQPASADAIQLITCHKAKGLEWQAVIVPFLARRIYPWNERYPRLIKKADEIVVALDREDIDDATQAAFRRTERQEMERLLYVALTRARHTLVLAVDAALFASPRGEVHESSELRLLRAAKSDEANYEHFQRIAADAVACDITSTQQTGDLTTGTGNQPDPVLPKVRLGDIDVATATASVFPRKLVPSAYAADAGEIARGRADHNEVDPEFRPRVLDNPATRYGSWWHGLMEQLNWAGEANSWDAVFNVATDSSPDPQRAKREWRLFREWLTSDSPISRQFRAASNHPHIEMPFLWRMDENACLEGLIDLALINRKLGTCLILDWKTNQVRKSELETLRQQYKPQLAAYWNAVGKISGMKVEAGLYSTHTGSWLPYEQHELEHEWNRLEKLGGLSAVAELKAVAGDGDVSDSHAAVAVQTVLWPE